jgi:acetyl esterase/lipase
MTLAATWRRLGAAALVAALLAGCSPVSILNVLAPTGNLEIRPAVAYGEHPRQRLDTYTPREAAEPRPVVVFFYGGGWDSGSRGSYLFVAEALASRGFVVVVPDYRVYPEVVFPAFLDDSAAAVAWTVRNAHAIGGDPSRVFLMGHSAGAHIAAMLSLDPQYLARSGLTPAAISGFIGLAGPYDFLPLKEERLKIIFAPPEAIARTQPINFVRPGAPRAFLAAPGTDDRVNPGNTVRLSAKLRAAGVPVTEQSYAGLNHYTIVAALSVALRGSYPLLDDIERFVRANAKGAATAPRPAS